MRSRNEPRHGARPPKLLPAVSGEPIQAAAFCYETAIFKMPQRREERTVAHLPGESNRVGVTPHQSEQPCLEHAAP